MDTFNEFLSKNLNTNDWYVYNVFPDYKLQGQITVTLKAKKDITIYNELTKAFIIIKKNGFIRGLMDKWCLRTVLYIPTCVKNREYDELLNKSSLKDVLIRPLEVGQNVVQVIRAYIPDKSICIKLHKIEQQTKQLKNEINNHIIYMPVRGIKYQELINDTDFKERWKHYDNLIN